MVGVWLPPAPPCACAVTNNDGDDMDDGKPRPPAAELSASGVCTLRVQSLGVSARLIDVASCAVCRAFHRQHGRPLARGRRAAHGTRCPRRVYVTCTQLCMCCSFVYGVRAGEGRLTTWGLRWRVCACCVTDNFADPKSLVRDASVDSVASGERVAHVDRALASGSDAVMLGNFPEAQRCFEVAASLAHSMGAL